MEHSILMPCVVCLKDEDLKECPWCLLPFHAACSKRMRDLLVSLDSAIPREHRCPNQMMRLLPDTRRLCDACFQTCMPVTEQGELHTKRKHALWIQIMQIQVRSGDTANENIIEQTTTRHTKHHVIFKTRICQHANDVLWNTRWSCRSCLQHLLIC